MGTTVRRSAYQEVDNYILKLKEKIKMPRIAIVTHKIVKRGSGQGKVNYDFVSSLIKLKNLEIHLYAEEVTSELLEKVKFHPIRVIPRPYLIKMPMFMIVASCKLFFKKYDIIFVDEGTYLGKYDFIGVHFCHKRYLKHKMRVYDRIYETINSWVERFEYKRKGTIIAVSYKVKKELMEEFKIEKERIKVIYNGIKITPSESKKQSSSFLLLFAGDLSYRKGLDFLIKTMKEMNENIKLLVAGKKRKKYLQLAKNLDVKFLGFRENLVPLFSQVDAFILPSIYEPFGMVVLEAMAAGLPVIVSSYAGVSELIEDGKTGVIVKNPTNVEELKQKILLLFRDIKLRKTIGKMGQMVIEKYTPEQTTKKKIKLLKEKIKPYL